MWQNKFVNSAKNTNKIINNEYTGKLIDTAQSAKDTFNLLGDISEIGKIESGWGRLQKIGEMVIKAITAMG